MVDDEDFESLSKCKWYAMWNPETRSFYAVRKAPTEPDGKRRTMRMHREIMSAEVSQLVDHWNHDTLDNRRQNLRLCTNSQNKQNGRGHIDSTSGYKGVSWSKRDQRWVANIRVNKKPKYLGLFMNPIEAAKAYDVAATANFGTFALTNRALGNFSTNH